MDFRALSEPQAELSLSRWLGHVGLICCYLESKGLHSETAEARLDTVALLALNYWVRSKPIP